MDANLTINTDVCSCCAPQSEGELFEDTVKKGPLWLRVVRGCAEVLFGLILVSILIVNFGLFGGLAVWFGVLFIFELFTKKPARSQVLRCRHCGTNSVVPKN